MDFATAKNLKTLATEMGVKDSALRTFLKKHPRLVPEVQKRKDLVGRLLFTPFEAGIVLTGWHMFEAGRCVNCSYHPVLGTKYAQKAYDAPSEPEPTEDTPAHADAADGSAGGAE